MMVRSNNECRFLLGVSVLVFIINLIFGCEGFSPVAPAPTISFGSSAGFTRTPYFTLFLQKGWLDNDGEDEECLVTREDLNRDMLGLEPKVKRKRKNKKGQGYRPLDNRDHLPFSVRTKTPDDPYKSRFQKQKEQQLIKKGNIVNSKATDLDRHMLASTRRESEKIKSKSKKNAKSNEHKVDGSTTPSRLIEKRSKKKKNAAGDMSATTVIGEFELDKSTTSGDIIALGDNEYRVETARCQYKYAGGQRFVMVRKILEVKELSRVVNEESLLRQYKSSPSSSKLSEDLE
mmetsp:Transcript_8494/g.17711  ORF Transcript_8494/g.17711 Transcript_8494/m.17711 type:complete len:289 (+) Transcript_8494:157-1023(+)